MLDTFSLRAAFGVVALTLLVLFYLVTYRTTRSAYCGWWCVSLTLFMLGSSAYYFDGTEHQVWANPLGNVLLVLGAASVWAGARSVRPRSTPAWQLAVPSGVMALASALDSPATNDWSGGPLLLANLSAYVGLASWELWRLQRRAAADPEPDHAWLVVVRSMAVASSLFSAFYAARLVAFVLGGGPDSEVFRTFFGSQVTTLMTTVLLATVSFSMSSLSNVQETGVLRERADVDGLTGLLNRGAFRRVALSRLTSARSASTSGSPWSAAVVVADVDHFKSINDTLGHAAGDDALRELASACRAATRPGDVLGRLGGDEFALLLPGASAARGHDVAAAVSSRLAGGSGRDGTRLPTISFGVAELEGPGDLEGALARADAALYQAKAAGRDQSVGPG